MAGKAGFDKTRFYEGIAGEWDAIMNRYDLLKRLSIVFAELLPESLSGLDVLDAGSGLGYFTRAAAERGARVTAVDIGPKLLGEVSTRCPSAVTMVSSLTDLVLESASFDVVICTEVIEHTNAPHRALLEIHRVLRPGGVLALTVPNRIWKWSVVVANAFRWRRYQGFENWQGYFALRAWVRRNGFIVEDWFGFNLLPFQIKPFLPVNRLADRAGHLFGPIMINIAARLRKPLEY